MRRRVTSFFGAALLLQLVSQQIKPVSALFGIGEQRFKYEGLIDLGSLGLDTAKGMVAALGDLDGGQFLELFLLSPDQRTISSWQWNRKQYKYEAVANSGGIQAPWVITNVVPGDYDYDGRLDLLVMGQENPDGWFKDDEVKMLFYRGLGGGNFSQPMSVPSSALQQPIPLDASGDMKISLLGFPFGDDKKENLKLWRNDWQESNQTQLFSLAEPPLDSATFNCKIPSPHSNAFIDLDGDCLADLFLVCQDSASSTGLAYQIWINSKESGFRLAQTGSLPAGTGQISFADMDRDGTIDMVFATCTSREGCHINIAYNQQMPLCTTTGGLTSSSAPKARRCRDVGELCVADTDFRFDLSRDASNSAFQRIPLSSLLPSQPYFILQDDAFRGSLPNSIRIGDYNKDGYPDLLVIAASSSSAHQGTVALLQSVECSRTTCSQAETQADRRAFIRVQGDKAAALNNINDAKSAIWLDIDEDGTLDMLVQRSGLSSGASRQFKFIKNNYFHDAFFLKTMTSNGACDGACVTAEGEKYQPYGVSYSGASYKFTVLDTGGTRRATQVGQLPQTAYLSLQLPYSYFGLGRTNNYVENLLVGSTRHQDEHYMAIEGVIPNSQVVIVPWQPEDGHGPSTWTKQLFLMPGRWIPWVGVTLVTTIIVLAITVLVLHINEKRQDELERRRGMHLINFDAL
ncbi:hypothetical protein P389DRAFT_169746 [Cystobasidium minutum MCA 4210]|uniref:uncharacterized protein n=1 Tax=Cystobasidium minutum MCA 4210 TaxID=1397322 RepID=UPI0034CFE6CC|eukprot:jgi/Rhomi1/169746/fgenesh1_kg.3_\